MSAGHADGVPRELPEHTERHFDAIDAGFFSGDTFHSHEAIARAEWYFARWQREIASIKEMLSDDQKP